MALIVIALLAAACTIQSNERDKQIEYVTLEYIPMQCETTPWNAWLANSSIRFFRAPTDKEIIVMFYSQPEHMVEIKDFQKIQTSDAVCEACGVCPMGYKFVVKVSENDVQKMLDTGWKKVESSTSNTQMANPASTNCIDIGGQLDIRTADDGSQYGICTLPSGKECDEWALYREECS